MYKGCEGDKGDKGDKYGTGSNTRSLLVNNFSTSYTWSKIATSEHKENEPTLLASMADLSICTVASPPTAFAMSSPSEEVVAVSPMGGFEIRARMTLTWDGSGQWVITEEADEGNKHQCMA